MTQLQPFKFKPILRKVLWGGNKIATYKGLDSNTQHVGESWEISGIDGAETVVACGDDAGLTLSQLIDKYGGKLVGDEVYRKFGHHFPLLIKFIDAAHDLSIQVHPRGKKDELWYIVDTEPGAAIHVGFNRPITGDQYEAHVKQHTIMSVINKHTSREGDVFFLPAGQIHSIGAGNLLAEIQQASTDTYRIYDYDRIDCNGKKRELHTELARKEIDYTVYHGKIDYHQASNESVNLAQGEHFAVNKIIVDGCCEMPMNNNKNFKILMCIKGQISLTDDLGNNTLAHQGETLLIPACMPHITIKGQAECLITTT